MALSSHLFFLAEDESGGEDERGGSGYLGDHFLVGLKAKLKELTSAHDVVNKNRCSVCVRVCLWG